MLLSEQGLPQLLEWWLALNAGIGKFGLGQATPVSAAKLMFMFDASALPLQMKSTAGSQWRQRRKKKGTKSIRYHSVIEVCAFFSLPLNQHLPERNNEGALSVRALRHRAKATVYQPP